MPLFQVGLLKSPAADDSPTKDMSPFKEIMQTLEKPPNSGPPDFNRKAVRNRPYNSPPRSADYYSGNKNKGSFFFHNFAVRKGHNFRLPRSASMRTPSPPPSAAKSPPPPPANRPLNSSSTPGSFQALSKLRKSLRDKKSASSAGIPTAISSGNSSLFSHDSPTRKNLAKNMSLGSVVQEESDLINALRDEAQASKDVIVVLRKQIDELEKEKETL